MLDTHMDPSDLHQIHSQDTAYTTADLWRCFVTLNPKPSLVILLKLRAWTQDAARPDLHDRGLGFKGVGVSVGVLGSGDLGGWGFGRCFRVRDASKP